MPPRRSERVNGPQQCGFLRRQSCGWGFCKPLVLGAAGLRRVERGRARIAPLRIRPALDLRASARGCALSAACTMWRGIGCICRTCPFPPMLAGSTQGTGTHPSIAMGRRSTHTPQQLRELILDAAQDIIQVQGLAGLSAREIARRIEYSPGTIYNMFENLDDVVLHVESRVLEALDKRLSALLQDGNAAGRVARLAQTYLAFTHENPRLWNLLFEHHMPSGADLPPWYQQKLEGLMGRVEEALAPLFP